MCVVGICLPCGTDGNLLAWLSKLLLFVGTAAGPAEPPWELPPSQAGLGEFPVPFLQG